MTAGETKIAASRARHARGAVSPVGVLGILAAASLWALVGLVTKRLYAIAAISPLAVGALRLMLAAPALVALSAGFERRSWRIARRDAWRFALYGTVTAAYQLGFLGALTSTTVTAATLLLTTAPVFVALLAGLFLGEWPTRARAVLLLLAIVGAALVVLGSGTPGTGGALRLDGAALRGDLLALGAALAYACYYLLSSVLGARYGGIQVMTIAIGGGSVLLLSVALAAGGLVASVRGLTGEGWALILVLALGSTALSYAIYGLAMRRTPATLASVAALIEPLIAAALAWRFLGERLAPIGIAGGALLLGGIAATYMLRAREGVAANPAPAPEVAD
jgi:DME family drug/metabolite transporter